MVDGLLPELWRDLELDPSALDALVPTGGELTPLLPSPLPVGTLAHDALAAVSLLAVPGNLRPGARTVRLEPRHVATAYGSERYFRRDGEEPDLWAPLSGFWRAADGWIRTHANYPHHLQRLLGALELPTDSTPASLAERLATLSRFDAAESITAYGGVAAAVRTAEEWRSSGAGAAVAGQPLLARHRIDEAPALPGPGPDPLRPLDGLRVLDLTRVLAGPIATRTLALLGADVLRVDPPFLPEPATQYLDTGAGKRSILLDVHTRPDRDRFLDLLAEADVLVTGYRPGSLDALGLDPAAAAERRPGLVVARLSTWGAGPWGDRRGFDSIVQAASGIAVLCGTDERPGALPVQALDHSAGYLLAAGVLAALRSRADRGGSWLVETSLARVATGLLALPRPTAPAAQSFEPTVLTRATASGVLTYAAPAVAGVPGDWPFVGAAYGAAEPMWGGAA